MATSAEYIEFVCEQIHRAGEIRYRKMFGEYMVYVNDKPILLVCDNTVYVKKREEIHKIMTGSALGIPYDGSKEHYILDIENSELCCEVIRLLELVTPIPKPRKRKTK